MDSHTSLQKYLKKHSEKSKTRHKQKPHERIDIHSIAMVKAKQYIVENEKKIKRNVTYKMLQNIGIFRSLSKKLLKNLANEFEPKILHKAWL